MMVQPKMIICLLCREEVYFTLLEIKAYLDHLKSEHHIEFYSHLTLMINLMGKNYVDYFSNITPVSKPKTLLCLLCRKENNFSDEKGDQYSSHLRNEHRIIFNLQLIKSINLMDNDGQREIIKKFEETYNIDDEEKPSNDYFETKIIRNNAENDNTNLIKKSKNDEEKMLIEDRSTIDVSMTTAQHEQEVKFDELEEELISGSEAMNYYKSKTVDAEMVEQVNIKNQSETLYNNSNHNYANVIFPNDSMNIMENSTIYSFESSASVNDSGLPTGGEFDPVIEPKASNNLPYGTSTMPNGKPFSTEEEFDSVIKPEASNNLPYGTSSTPSSYNSAIFAKRVKSSKYDFSEAVQKEIDNGNLSTTMDISYEKTHRKMKEISAMFMNGTSCTACGKGSNSKSHLHEHIESIHNTLPVYFCNLCQLPLSSTGGYRKHKKKCTGVVNSSDSMLYSSIRTVLNKK